MTVRYFKRALEDVFTNKFLTLVTIVTISLSILIVSSFVLVFINANDIVSLWKQGIRMMVYLKPETTQEQVADLKVAIQAMAGIQRVQFVSKDQALSQLKEQMKRQSALFDNLTQNPLPDAFEIQMQPDSQTWESVETLAGKIESLKAVEEVEYGQRWLGRVTYFFNLFRLAGYALAGLFFMAAVFIVANTIRLVLYSRRHEVEIMRLVGASEGFIKIPFYIEGIIQGAVGGIIGIFVLFGLFWLTSLQIEQGYFSQWFQIRFLPVEMVVGIIGASMAVGWFGCYLSVRQFLRL
jgi:cell division transport system permease protein